MQRSAVLRPGLERRPGRAGLPGAAAGTGDSIRGSAPSRDTPAAPPAKKGKKSRKASAVKKTATPPPENEMPSTPAIAPIATAAYGPWSLGKIDVPAGATVRRNVVRETGDASFLYLLEPGAEKPVLQSNGRHSWTAGMPEGPAMFFIDGSGHGSGALFRRDGQLPSLGCRPAGQPACEKRKRPIRGGERPSGADPSPLERRPAVHRRRIDPVGRGLDPATLPCPFRIPRKRCVHNGTGKGGAEIECALPFLPERH